MDVRVRFAVLVVAVLPVAVSCGAEGDPPARLVEECATQVTSEPGDTETSAANLPQLISWYDNPVALTGDVDAVERTITVTDPIAISKNPGAMAVGRKLTIELFSLCQVPELVELEEATVLGTLGSEQDLSIIAVVDADERLTPRTWQQSYDDVRALLGTGDRRSTLQSLVERSVEDPTFAAPSEPEPYDTWLALPPDQRQLDPAATPPRVLEEFGVTAATIRFDMPAELRRAPGEDAEASDETFVRLSAPGLAVINTVAASISDTLIGPSLIPADGPLVVDIVAANGEVLAGPFDVSELRQIPTDNDTFPTIRVRTDGSTGWQVTVVIAPQR